jgi:hypothetical protein
MTGKLEAGELFVTERRKDDRDTGVGLFELSE